MAAPLRRNCLTFSSCLRKKLSIPCSVTRASSSLIASGIRPRTVKRPAIATCLRNIEVVHCQQHPYSTDTPVIVNEEEEDVLYKELLVEVKGHDVPVLNSYEKFVRMAARELNINIVKIWTPSRIIEKYTVLKSVHIFKKHRVQYEARTNFRTIEIKHITGSTADTFLEYIQRNLPEGVAMKVTKHRIERLPEHVQQPPTEAIESAS